MQILKPSKQSITTAIKILENGGVVVFPTDTVYGFLCLAENKKAVAKIYKIKKRDKKKPLPIFVKDLKMAKEIAIIDSPSFAKASAGKEKILKSKWPGKYTFVLKAQSLKPKAQKNPKSQIFKLSKLVVKNGTVALRVPKYKILNDLLKKINKPLAQTSVNISGQPPLSKSKDIMETFGKDKRIDLIIDGGNLKKSKPSKIIELTSSKNKIIRK